MAGVLGLDFDPGNPLAGDGPRLAGWASDAVIDMLMRTHCYIDTATMALTSGQGDYDMDASILAIEDIYASSSGSNFRLTRKSSTDLINLLIFSVTTSPEQYYAVAGTNMLMLYPAPLLADTLTIYYVPRPDPLVSPNDDPSNISLGGIPPEFHYGLELYMQWKAGDAFDDESSQSGETYRILYEGNQNARPGSYAGDGFIGEMKKNIRRKGGKHLGPALIPPRSRRIYVPNPGVDTGSQYSG